MTKITLEIGGLLFLEPMAFLLNWVMMIQSIYYYNKLKNWRFSGYCINWRWFFLLFAISSCFGGIGHLLYEYTGLAGKMPGWIVSLGAITAAEMAMSSTLSLKKKVFYQRVSFFKLIFFAGLLLFYTNFNVVILHTFGLVFYIAIPALQTIIRQEKQLQYTFLGLLVLFLTLPFRIFQIDFHLWMNRDDIAHIFMIMTLFLFQRGVVVFEETQLERDPQLARI